GRAPRLGHRRGPLRDLREGARRRHSGAASRPVRGARGDAVMKEKVKKKMAKKTTPPKGRHGDLIVLSINAETFEQLADAVSDMAAKIPCAPSDYRDGLTTLIERLETDRRASSEMNPDDEG